MTSDPNPLVSVIVPAYNAEGFLAGAVESVLAQTYKNLDILVVNDGSTDDTQRVAESFVPRGVRVIRQENKGVGGVRNTGIKNAKGTFIAFLDADDFYLPEKIEKEVRFLQEHPEFDLVYCNMHHFYAEAPEVLYQHKGPFYSGDVFEKLLDTFFGQLDTVLIPKAAYDEVGLYDEGSKHAEEWDVHLKLARAGYRFGFLDENLVRIRVSKNSWSRFSNQPDQKQHNLAVLERLSQTMSEEERQHFRIPERVRRWKFRLAIANLVVGDKRGFARYLMQSASNGLKKVFFGLAIGIAYLFPASFLRWVTESLWSLRHKMLLQREGASH